MKVRCIHNNRSEVPILAEKHGYSDRSILHITKGKEYTVYAVICDQLAPNFLPSIEYVIRDDLNNDIATYNAQLFEVTDSRLGSCDWHYSFGKNGMDFIIGYDEFVNKRTHYEGVLLRNKVERSKFLAWCDLVDKSIE